MKGAWYTWHNLPDSEFTRHHHQGISFSQYRRNVERLALGLASLGVKRDDKVAITSENRPE